MRTPLRAGPSSHREATALESDCQKEKRLGPALPVSAQRLDTQAGRLASATASLLPFVQWGCLLGLPRRESCVQGGKDRSLGFVAEKGLAVA